MRSHPKKRQVVQPDAAPRGDSSYMKSTYITISSSSFLFLYNILPLHQKSFTFFLLQLFSLVYFQIVSSYKKINKNRKHFHNQQRLFSNVCKYSRHLYSGTFHTSDFCITHPPLKTAAPSLMSGKSGKSDKLLSVQQDVKEVQENVRANKNSLEAHKQKVKKQHLEHSI